MPITHAYPLSCGNAIALHLDVPLGVSAWRVIRRIDEDFGSDVGNVVAAAGANDGYQYFSIIDAAAALANGVAHWYRLELQLAAGDPWYIDGNAVSATPAYLSESLYFASPDFAYLVRERLALALKSELLAGGLSHRSGEIPVLTAYPQVSGAPLPLVTVILTSRQPIMRGIGETIIPPDWDGSDWSIFDGWLDRSTLEIGVWSLNHADRVRLRDAVQRALLLNLPVFAAVDFEIPELQAHDTQDFTSFDAPIYQTVFTFSAQHPALVRIRFNAIASVDSGILLDDLTFGMGGGVASDPVTDEDFLLSDDSIFVLASDNGQYLLSQGTLH